MKYGAIFALLLVQVASISNLNYGGGGGGSIPQGAVILITGGACPAGYAEAIELDGVTVVGTLAANADIGGTGGVNLVTPAGTVAAPVFTGSALGSHAHGAGTYDNAAASGGTPDGTNAWPAGVPTNSGGAVNAHSGTAVADHASHTHTYTEVPNHVHPYCSQTATTGGASSYEHGAIDTSSAATECTLATNNPTGGVATGTTAGPSAVLTHSVTQPANHTFTQPTIAWPAGVPAFTGSALAAHDHALSGSSEAVSGGTPAGTNSAPAFTGTAFENRGAYVKVIFCRKT